MDQGLPLAPGIEISYLAKDNKRCEVDPARTASEFDATYYRGVLEKVCGEAAFVFRRKMKAWSLRCIEAKSFSGGISPHFKFSKR